MNVKQIVVFFLCFSSFMRTPVFAGHQPGVAVRLFEAHRPLHSLEVLPPFEIIDSNFSLQLNCQAVAIVQSGKVILQKNKQDKTSLGRSRLLHIRGVNGQPINLALGSSAARRRYHGDLFLSATKEGDLEIVNYVQLPDYIKDVVASEAPATAPLEALKAQAVLCQTRLYAGRQKKTISVGDSTSDQCYLGASLERASVKNAVNAVRGKLLYYKDTPAIVYYHSTCAGGTNGGARYLDLSKSTTPYLPAVLCKYCSHSPFWQPTRKLIPADLFAQEFGSVMPELLEQDYTGRALSLKLANGQIVSGYQFWIKLGQKFGWDKCPGTRYKLTKGTNGDIVIESTGAGHGVGLCQWGASELARRGKNYRQILQYYFPGCEVR